MDRAKLSKLVERSIIAKRRKQFTHEEYVVFKQKIAAIDLSLFAQHSVQQVIPVLTEIIIDSLKTVVSQDTKAVDIHEILRNEIGTEAEGGQLTRRVAATATINTLLRTPKILRHIFNPAATHTTNYLLLDSRYRNRAVADPTVNFQWHVAAFGTTYDASTTAVASEILHDIIKIKIFPFQFPNTPNAIGDTSRLGVEFVEFDAQAMMFPAYNKRLHALFAISRTAAAPSDAPFTCNDLGQSPTEFIFHTPFTEVTNLTMRFSNPYYNLTLDPDQLPATITSVGVQALLTFTSPHHCEVGDIVQVLDFVTTMPLDDTVQITQMLDVNGWAIVVVTPTTMLIDVDLSGLAGVIVGTNQIYLQAKRFVIRLELTYIDHINFEDADSSITGMKKQMV